MSVSFDTALAFDQPARRSARSRYNLKELQDLKGRDNRTNLYYIAVVYAVMIATIAITIWSYALVAAAGLSWWYNIPMSIVAVCIMGASQHQLGGIVHEGTHYILFENRRMNELVSDWMAAFPIYTSTYYFRLHHLAHHQFVNDPDRDPNFAQAKDSGHWLDFPLTHIELLVATLKQLNPVRLVSYIMARARYSAMGVDTNPYADTERSGSPWVMRIGLMFAGGIPAIMVACILNKTWGLAFIALGILWAVTVAYYALIPASHFSQSKIEPVISHRESAIYRISYMALLYGGLTLTHFATGVHAWRWFLLLWIVPLFTTFPLFMVLREWLQHGNADRGRYTNSRIFLVGPLARYAVFPWGMDYHLPHHLFVSVPHYKLKDLHQLMLRDPEYAEKGVIVENWVKRGDVGYPTLMDVLGPEYAPKTAASEIHVDDDTLELAEVNDKAAIARQVEASRAAGEPG